MNQRKKFEHWCSHKIVLSEKEMILSKWMIEVIKYSYTEIDIDPDFNHAHNHTFFQISKFMVMEILMFIILIHTFCNNRATLTLKCLKSNSWFKFSPEMPCSNFGFVVTFTTKCEHRCSYKILFEIISIISILLKMSMWQKAHRKGKGLVTEDTVV